MLQGSQSDNRSLALLFCDSQPVIPVMSALLCLMDLAGLSLSFLLCLTCLNYNHSLYKHAGNLHELLLNVNL